MNESMTSFIQELHHDQEVAFLTGDQQKLDEVNVMLDEIVTDEALGIMKGDI